MSEKQIEITLRVSPELIRDASPGLVKILGREVIRLAEQLLRDQPQPKENAT